MTITSNKKNNTIISLFIFLTKILHIYIFRNVSYKIAWQPAEKFLVTYETFPKSGSALLTSSGKAQVIVSYGVKQIIP